MKAHVIQNNFASGVLEPRILGRNDVPLYQKGLQSAQNCITIPLGGIRRRPGLRYIDTAQRKISANIATPTMINGGTPGDIDDHDNPEASSTTTTTNISTLDPYVVAEYDYTIATNQYVIDVVEIFLTTGTSDEFYVQDSDDGIAWSNVGQLPIVDSVARSYRFVGNTKRYLRLARIGSTDLLTAKITLSGFFSYSSGDISDVQLIDFVISDSFKFFLVLTDRNIAVYKDDAFYRNLRSPFESDIVRDVDWTRLEAVMIMVQEDNTPMRLFYDEASDYFTFDIVPFASVPRFDYNDSLSPVPIKAVHQIEFVGFDKGQLFKLSLNGFLTEEGIYYGDTDDTANQIKLILENLPIVGFAGIEDVNGLGAAKWNITFAKSSTDNFNKAFIGYGTTGDVADKVNISDVTTGSSRKKDVWSNTRGYPRSTTFYQNRLWFGGTKSKPQSLFASRLNSYLDFKQGFGTDTDPIFVTLDAKKRNKIMALLASRALCIFTDDSEFTSQSGVIKTSEFSVMSQTAHGSGTPNPVFIDGAVLFLEKDSGSLREFLFSFNEDSYTSANRSVVSQHLINSPVDFDSVRPSVTDDANYAVIINADGTATIYNTLREQEVSNFMPMSTNGKFTACQAVDREMYFGVIREINSGEEVLIEKWDYACFTDSAVKVVNDPPDAVVTGLDHLNGLECRVRADSSVMVNATPSGGSITLSRDAENIEVGLDYPCSFQIMPLSPHEP